MIPGPPYTLLEELELVEPVLVLGLEGWFDVGFGGAAAVAHLVETLGTRVVAEFDGDRFIDHRARRPVMRIVDGMNAGLTWPTIELRAGRDGDGRDVLVLTGPEPDLHWHEFAASVVTLASELDVRLAAALAAFPAAVAHTRPVKLTSTATSAELAAKVGFIPTTLDIPAGIHSVLEVELGDAGIPAVGLWAQVPGYAAGMPYPAASVALIKALGEIAELKLDSGSLDDAATGAFERIEALVEASEEHQAMVAQLEAQADSVTSAEEEFGGPLPTGEELAQELEKFLRTLPGGGEGDPRPPA